MSLFSSESEGALLSSSKSSTLEVIIIRRDNILQEVTVAINKGRKTVGTSCDAEVGQANLVRGDLNEGHLSDINSAFEEGDKGNDEKDGEDTDLEGPGFLGLLRY
jgi:hypothetical protein